MKKELEIISYLKVALNLAQGEDLELLRYLIEMAIMEANSPSSVKAGLS